jgi:TRAP-type C4-dicarboxylate transport system permease small subunit
MDGAEKRDKLMFRILDLFNGLLVAAMALAIFLQVLARYAFNYPLGWPEELGRFLFAWIVFLGIVPVLRMDEMPCLDLVYQWIPEKAGHFLKFIVSVVILGFLLIMLKGGWELMVRQTTQISVALQVPMALVYFAIPLGTLLMCFLMVFKVFDQGKTLFLKRKTLKQEGRS